MLSRSFLRMSTVSVSTKRNPDKVAGVIGAPQVYLTNLSAVPLMPISDELRLRYSIETPRKALVTYILGSVDVLEGDILVIGGTEYPIRAVGAWAPYDYVEVIVDRVKGT